MKTIAVVKHFKPESSSVSLFAVGLMYKYVRTGSALEIRSDYYTCTIKFCFYTEPGHGDRNSQV